MDSEKFLDYVWIHDTETSDGWKTDVIYSFAQHKEFQKYSDGFAQYVHLENFKKEQKEHKDCLALYHKADKVIQILLKTLERISSQDYRGNRPKDAIEAEVAVFDAKVLMNDEIKKVMDQDESITPFCVSCSTVLHMRKVVGGYRCFSCGHQIAVPVEKKSH